MVSPSGGPPKGPSSSPQGPHQGSSSGRGAPNPDVVRGASPSISTTDDSSRRDCSPSWAPPPYPSSQMGAPRGPPWGPQGKPAAARSHKGGAPLHSAVSVEGVGPHISSRRPVEGSLSLRGPRGAPHRSTGFSSAAAAAASAAAADSEVYVHLTDGESASSADEGEEMRVRAGSSNEWVRRTKRVLQCMHRYSSLAKRRASLGLRFLIFSIRQNERQLKILLYTAGLLIASTGNTISFKRMLDKMPNYSGFLNQLTNFVFIPIFAALCLYQYSVGKLSQEVLSFPKKNFALMGCLDGVCGIMAVVGGVHTSGTAQVVLSQLGIPVMLFLCRFMLGKKYNAIQHLGAAVIILGVLIVESPGLLHPSKEDSSNAPFFNLLFLLSVLPSSLSYVVKEIAFRGVQMNTSFLQFWVALFQFFVGFALLPLTSLPLLGQEVVPLNELWRRLVDGGRCLLGVNIIVPPVCGPDMGLACDSCQGAWVEVAVYIIFNLIYNVCSMLVLKHCGATVLFLIMTVRLPLTSMAFYSKLIVGDSAVPAKPTDFFGLLVLLVGLLAFRLGGHKTARREGEGAEEEEGEGSLDQDITATAEAAHVHIKVLASDPSIRNDGYFHCFSDEEMPTPRGRRRQRQPEVYTPPNPQPDAPEEGGAPGGLFVGGPRRR